MSVEMDNGITENVAKFDVLEEVAVDPVTRGLNTMLELIDTLAKTSKSLTTEIKTLTKDVNKLRLSKNGGKKQKRVINSDTPRKLGALEKPIPISEELREFLELTKGEMYSRQRITQLINKFVKDNSLQNPENRRYILLESEVGLKLKKLLKDPDQPLTFFNIQRYLKVHYLKVDLESDSSSKGKTVDVMENAPSANVVEDAAVVDETEEEAPKKKIVRKVVKKSSTQ